MFRSSMAGLITVGFLLLQAVTLAAAPANPKVLMKTSKGEITLELYPDKAPVTVKNFLSYVDKKFYDGTIFHRVIKGFMIQGGGLTGDMHEKAAGPTIKNEAANGLKNLKGTIAMARGGEINSADSQFFINHIDNPYLDHQSKDPDKYGYAVFGKVVAGMDVVEAIASVPVGSKRGHADVPREPVVILSVSRVKNP